MRFETEPVIRMEGSDRGQKAESARRTAGAALNPTMTVSDAMLYFPQAQVTIRDAPAVSLRMS